MSGPDENPDTCMWELKSYTVCVLMLFCCDSPFVSVEENLTKKQVTVTVVLDFSSACGFVSEVTCVSHWMPQVWEGLYFMSVNIGFTQMITFSLEQNDASSPARHHLSRYTFRIMFTYYEHPISVSSPVQSSPAVHVGVYYRPEIFFILTAVKYNF